MPTVLRVGASRYFFYSNEGTEPPHIHVEYGEFEAQFDIVNGRLLAGKLPPRAQKLVKEWLKLRKNEVIKAWKIAEKLENPPRIKPLE